MFLRLTIETTLHACKHAGLQISRVYDTCHKVSAAASAILAAWQSWLSPVLVTITITITIIHLGPALGGRHKGDTRSSSTQGQASKGVHGHLQRSNLSHAYLARLILGVMANGTALLSSTSASAGCIRSFAICKPQLQRQLRRQHAWQSASHDCQVGRLHTKQLKLCYIDAEHVKIAF